MKRLTPEREQQIRNFPGYFPEAQAAIRDLLYEIDCLRDVIEANNSELKIEFSKEMIHTLLGGGVICLNSREQQVRFSVEDF
jgi:hypothetical protein